MNTLNKFFILVLSLCVLVACDKGHKEPTIASPSLKFAIDDKDIDSTKEITQPQEGEHPAADPSGKKALSLSSPYVQVNFPTNLQGKKLKFSLRMLDHTEDPNVGIVSFCTDQCSNYDNAPKQVEESVTISTASMALHVDLLLKEKWTVGDSYRVELKIEEGAKEIGKLVFVFMPKTEASAIKAPKDQAPTPPSSIKAAPTPSNTPTEPAPSTPTEPAPSTPKEPAPSTPKEPAPSAPTEPIPPMVDGSMQKENSPKPSIPSAASQKLEELMSATPWPQKPSVLFMDFIGQGCGPCLNLAREIEQWKRELGDLFLPVALHPYGGSGWGASSPDLYVQDAAYYRWQLGGRAATPSTFLNNNSNWGGSAGHANILNATKYSSNPVLVKSVVTARLIDNKQVEISFLSKTKDNAAQLKEHPNVSVLFWLVEDDVKAYFYNESNHKHQHVFRGVIKDGQDYKPTKQGEHAYLYGEPYTMGSSITVTRHLPKVTYPSSGIVKDKCHVVAILVDDSTHTFLDGVSAKLK